jgi:hypothetical protein
VFSKTLSLCSSLKVTDQVSHPYSTLNCTLKYVITVYFHALPKSKILSFFIQIMYPVHTQAINEDQASFRFWEIHSSKARPCGDKIYLHAPRAAVCWSAKLRDHWF